MVDAHVCQIALLRFSPVQPMGSSLITKEGARLERETSCGSKRQRQYYLDPAILGVNGVAVRGAKPLHHFPKRDQNIRRKCDFEFPGLHGSSFVSRLICGLQELFCCHFLCGLIAVGRGRRSLNLCSCESFFEVYPALKGVRRI